MHRIVIIAPAPIDGSGGVARIYKFAHALAQRGDDCRIYIFNSNDAEISKLATQAEIFYGCSGFGIHTNLDGLPGAIDLVISTRWDTVKISYEISTKHRAYLIQDYEAYFNPVGDGSLLAENSYMMGLQPLTYGRWLAAKLANDFNNKPFYFDFASDTSKFQCKVPMEERLKTDPRLVFVYQNDKPRRCPHLGIEALGIVKHFRPHVSLYFVGSNSAPHIWYDFENVGNLSIEELNNLYNQCLVGVSLSSSNPSCNAFDMMAAGLPSVDLFRQNNLYDVPPQGVLLAYQSAESIAEAIIHLLDHPAELITRSKSGIDFMRSRSQEREVDSFVSAVDGILEGETNKYELYSINTRLYDSPPVVAQVNRNNYVDTYLHKQTEMSQGLRRPNGRQLSLIDPLLHRVGFGRRGQRKPIAYYPSAVRYEVTPNAPPLVQDRSAKRYERLVERLVRRYSADYRLTAQLFDAKYYLQKYPDVADAGADPLHHFIRHGISEGRSPSPFFDAEWYANSYPESKRDSWSAIEHYIKVGSALNQSPNSVFDAIWYIARYPDVRNSAIHPLRHFILQGEVERRDPSGKFQTAWYLDTNPDVASHGMSPLRHYLEFGKSEGRRPMPEAPPRISETWQGSHYLAVGEITDIFSWSATASDVEPEVVRGEQLVLDGDQSEKQVSFDVWNTIIHRRCHPDEIKLRSARYLLLTAWDDVRPALRSPVRLMSARMRAENASAPHGDYEYRFIDAIPAWLREVLVPSCDAARRAALSASLVAHELTAEAGSIELDENVARAIQRLKKAPIFISDFYMDSSFIERLLTRLGLGQCFAHGYASCDIFKNKRSGELFSHVLNDLDLTATDLVHVGDNYVSDVERPRSFGIETAPYVSKADEDRNEWYATAFHRLCEGDRVDHNRRVLALVKTAVAPSDEDDGEAAALFEAGTNIGLLTFGYCLNVMQDAIARNAKRVVFFAREGIIFKKIYDLIAAENPFDVPAPPSTLIFVSRRATFAASLASYDNGELMRLWTMYSSQSPIAFATSLNLDRAKATAAARRVGIDPDATVLAPWADTGFQSFLNDPAFKSYAVDELNRQRDLLQRYLRQEIPGDHDEYFVVDIGWRGTIQDNIAYTLQKPVRGHYLALYSYLNQQPDGSSKIAWLSDANNPGNFVFPENPTPFEMIFNGPGGSTIGYEDHDGQIVPVREVYPGEEATIEALTPCRLGMAAIVPALARYVRMHGLVASDLVDLNRKVANDIFTSPPTVIADVFGSLAHNETFGVGAVEAMDEFGFAEVAETTPGADLHGALKAWLGNRWPEGMSQQSIVADWSRSASPQALASAPLAITRAHSPGLVRTTGSRLVVYAPAPVEASGSYRTLANTVEVLADIGFNVEVYVAATNGNDDLLNHYFGRAPVTITTGWTVQRTPTLALATTAQSAEYVSQSVPALHKAYLVQDDEQALHPLSGSSIRVENSYTYGLHHLTVGNWLTHLIRKKYGAPAYPIGFGVDRGIYKAANATREQAICVLYQPEKVQRASDIALRAAEIVKGMRPDTIIYVYGSQQSPDLACDHRSLGFVHNAAELNALYNRCRAGICLSLSNPSRIPFEMAAAGCRPVDLYRYNNLMDHLGGVTRLTFQTPDSIAAGLVAALDEADAAVALAARMQHRTLEWEKDTIASHVLRILEGHHDEGWALHPLFDESPVFASVDDTPAARKFCSQQWIAATT